MLAEREVPSPGTSEEEVLAALDEAVEGLLDDRVVSDRLRRSPPTSSAKRAGCLWATNLPLDRRRPRRARSLERFGLPVGHRERRERRRARRVEAGRGDGASHDLVMLTLGTGVGGGIVVDGRLFRGWAEIGHVVVQAGAAASAPAAGTAISRCSRRDMRPIGSRARALRGRTRTRTSLVERAREGDERARRGARSRSAGPLGAAIGSLANVFDPELVVVGGGFGAAAGDLSCSTPRARRRAARRSIRPTSCCESSRRSSARRRAWSARVSSASRRSTGSADAARRLRDADREPRRRHAARARRSCARRTSSCARTRGVRGSCSTATGFGRGS